MISRMMTYVLLVGVIYTAGVIVTSWDRIRFQANNRGYEPEQPIAYSHRLHAGELAIPCLYCHSGAAKSRHAGIPAASICMNCHSKVTSSWGVTREELDLAVEEERDPRMIVSDELRKLYDSLGLDDELKPDPGKTPRSIEWIQVHNLPDYVYFSHSAHVNVGVECQQCHGEVQTFERMRQFSTLSMGWCVNCHRDVNENGLFGEKMNASLDCSACHF